MCTTTWAMAAPWQQVATYRLASKYSSFAKYFEKIIMNIVAINGKKITTVKERKAAMMPMTLSIIMTILCVLIPQHCFTPSYDIFVVPVSLFH